MGRREDPRKEWESLGRLQERRLKFKFPWAIVDADLTTDAVALLLLMVRVSHNDMGCFRGLSTLAENLSISIGRVRKALKILESKGWVIRVERSGKPSIFFPIIPNPEEADPYQIRQGSGARTPINTGRPPVSKSTGHPYQNDQGPYEDSNIEDKRLKKLPPVDCVDIPLPRARGEAAEDEESLSGEIDAKAEPPGESEPISPWLHMMFDLCETAEEARHTMRECFPSHESGDAFEHWLDSRFTDREPHVSDTDVNRVSTF